MATSSMQKVLAIAAVLAVVLHAAGAQEQPDVFTTCCQRCLAVGTECPDRCPNTLACVEGCDISIACMDSCRIRRVECVKGCASVMTTCLARTCGRQCPEPAAEAVGQSRSTVSATIPT